MLISVDPDSHQWLKISRLAEPDIYLIQILSDKKGQITD